MKENYCLVKDGIAYEPKYISLKRNITEEELNALNLYKYIVPEFDSKTQNLGAYIYDSQNNIVTREILDIIVDVNLIKTKYLNDLDYFQRMIIFHTWDWMITKEMKHGIKMSSDDKNAELAFKTFCDNLIVEINNLTENNIHDFNIQNRLIAYNSDFASILNKLVI